ncbi:MAG: hypothetical protein DHS20C14_05110 [Phycisphaeraceae bacterium]|nr:MAG: hypothetical protein DHS20C14_05110 [Phycisphaeraceae bacterium]
MASTTTTRLRGVCLLTAVAAVTLAAGGCSSSGSAESHHAGDVVALRKNPSPAMESLNRRQSDKRNRRAWANDTSLRMIHDDMARIWHADSPSRLTPVTKPY